MEKQIYKTRKETEKIANFPNVAFIGYFASGKTYYANLLAKKLEEKGINPYRVSIANKIKIIAKDVFDMKEKDRRLLQLLGAKMREIDENVWINYLILDIKRNNKIPFIIDDVRFRNEANLIKESYPNFLIVRLFADTEKRLDIYSDLYERKPTEEELNDPTEIDIDNIKYDESIINDYIPNTAEKAIDKLIEKYLWLDHTR